MIIFQTNRCTVRTFIPNDIQTVLEYRNNDEWMKYQGFKNKTAKEYEDALVTVFDIKKGSQLAIIHQVTKKLLGDLYLKLDETTISIGYTIHPIHSRKGYIKEVVLKAINYLSKTYPTHTIIAETDPLNEASSNLLQSIGFTLVESTNKDLRFRWGKQ